RKFRCCVFEAVPITLSFDPEGHAQGTPEPAARPAPVPRGDPSGSLLVRPRQTRAPSRAGELSQALAGDSTPGAGPSRSGTRRRSTARPNIGPVPQMALAQETIRRRLHAVPDTPGVYLLRDDSGQVIYVGKALRLRDRLRSYFTPGYAQTAR